MSYDVSLLGNKCVFCGEYPSIPEIGHGGITYNARAMYEEAMGVKSLTELNGKSGRECEPILKKGCLSMYSEPWVYRDLEPDNSECGTYEQFFEFLQELWYACLLYPDAMVEVN